MQQSTMPQFGSKPGLSRTPSLKQSSSVQRPDSVQQPVYSKKTATPRSRMPSKSTFTKILFIVLALSTLLLFACTIFLLATRNKSETTINSQPVETTFKNQDQVVPGFSNAQISNPTTDAEYTISSIIYDTDGKIALSFFIGQDSSAISANIDWSVATALYQLDLDRADQETRTIKFDQPIADFIIYSSSRNSAGEILLLLLSDGTIEYMPIKSGLSSDSFSSYGKLGELESIVKFYHAGTSSQYGDTILAQNTSGEIIDLRTLITSADTTVRNN